MWVPRDVLPPLRHTLRELLEGQGPIAVRQALNSEVGDALREHAEECADCAEVIAEVCGSTLPPAD